jgi:hypothetical protein
MLMYECNYDDCVNFTLKVRGVIVWDLEWLECVWAMNNGWVQLICR